MKLVRTTTELLFCVFEESNQTDFTYESLYIKPPTLCCAWPSVEGRFVPLPVDHYPKLVGDAREHEFEFLNEMEFLTVVAEGRVPDNMLEKLKCV